MKQPWYGDNEHRDYPFVPRAVPIVYSPDVDSSSSESLRLVDLPKDAIVDFGAIMEVDSGYVNAASDYIYLHAIVRSGDYLLYHFRTTPAASSSEECVFSRNIMTDEEFGVEWVESAAISGSIYTPADGCTIEPKWRAFMVTGVFDSLVDLLPADGALVFSRGLWRIEPAKIQTLANTYLRSVSLANYPRTIATAPAGCAGDDAEQATELVIGAECLAGDLSFIEGFNTTIRQENQNGTMIFGAGVGAGAGEACDEVPIESSEASPDNGAFLTGGPRCDQILMSLNGVTGRSFILSRGYGITITPSTDEPNTLIVARDTETLLLCANSESSIGS